MTSPVLVVGGGLAGLFCALKIAPHRPVTVLSGAPIGEGAASAWAQGGIAAALGPHDTPEKHAADTIAAGAGTVDPAVALSVAREAAARIDDLVRFGVPFDRGADGRLVLSREAAHGERRIVRVGGDGAGRAIMTALVAAVEATPTITLLPGYTTHALIKRGGRILGVRALGPDGCERAFPAAATVLATGGIGHLYAVTTNPPQACGRGLSMAARAGAVIADAEFVQFHPTAVDIGRDPAPLATEALRGEGAVLVDRHGTRFMPRLHADGELAPRDVVARGVFAEIAAGRGAFLDARAALGERFDAHFPTVAAACRAGGIDPARQPIPVAPAAHYHMGGVWTDARGRTSLPGLWGAGEVAATGLHGANRLASNSLLEAVVFAARAARDILAAEALPALAEVEADAPPVTSRDQDAGEEAALVQRLRATMSERVGVIRDGAGLSGALAEIRQIEAAAAGPALRDMATTALIVAAAALLRRESRGAHGRSDHPDADTALAHPSHLTLAQARRVADHAATHLEAVA